MNLEMVKPFDPEDYDEDHLEDSSDKDYYDRNPSMKNKF